MSNKSLQCVDFRGWKGPKGQQSVQTLTFKPGKAAKRSQSQCDLKLGGRFNFSATMIQNTKGDNTESGSQGPGEPLPMFALEPFDPELAGTLQFRCSKVDREDRKMLKSNISFLLFKVKYTLLGAPDSSVQSAVGFYKLLKTAAAAGNKADR